MPTHRRLDIQGLRAFAVLVVMAFHAGLPVPGGFVGVDVFFVISGYVITGALQREWQATGTLAFPRFYLRRYWRLTPALAVVVAVTVIAAAVLQSPFGDQATTAATGIGALFLAANAVIAYTTGGYFDGPAEGNPLLHMWSLSVEEQFYLLFPVLIFAGWMATRKRAKPWLGPLVAVVIISALSFFLAMFGGDYGVLGQGSWLTGFYSPLTRAWEFGAGALLLLLTPLVRLRRRGLAEIAGIGGALMLVASLWLITEDTVFPGKWTLLPVAGTVLVLWAGTSATNTTSAFLSMRVPVKLGDWSYSLYLWHWPPIVFAHLLWPGSLFATLLACALSVVPAVCSYYFVEAPLRHLPSARRAKIALATVAVTGIPLLLAGGLLFATNNGWWNDGIRQIQNANAYVGGTPGCFAESPDAMLNPADCVQNTGDRSAPVYLIGDSNADMLAPGLRAAAVEEASPFAAFTYSACPVIGEPFVFVSTGVPHSQGCLDYQDAALNWLDDAAPGTVFVASSDFYLRSAEVGLPRDGVVLTDQTDTVPIFAEGLGNVIARLESAGHQVVVVLPIPNFWKTDLASTLAAWRGPESCTTVALLASNCTTAIDTSLESMRERQGFIWDGLSQAALSHGATVLDLSTAVCRGDQCSVMRDGVPVYRDQNHITGMESVALAPEFAEVLQRVAAE